MKYDHRFIFEGATDDEELVLSIGQDFDLIEMEVVIDDEVVGRASMNVDEWISAIMMEKI